MNLNPFQRKPIVMEPPITKKTRSSDDCEIEIKNTSQGKKIRFRGNCKKEQIEAFAHQNGIDVGD